MKNIDEVKYFMDKSAVYRVEMEYINEIEKLALLINEKKANVKKEQLIEHMETLSCLSATVGAYTKTMKIWNALKKVTETEFFFPTVYQWKKSYKGYILLISHELTRTGAPIVLQDAARVLKEGGYYVLMLSPFDGALREELCAEGIPVIVNRQLCFGRFEEKPVKDSFWVSDIFVRNFDLSLFCTAVLHNAVERYQYMGKPIIWWLHEGSASFKLFGQYLPLKVAPDVHVAFVCEYVRAQLEKAGIHYDGIILNYGVKDSEVNKVETNGEKTTFIIVGTIDERKGQDILLEAIGLLPVEYLRKARFWFVGKENEEKVCDMLRMAAKGYSNIKMWGELPRQQVLELYDESECIICSSRDDPLPVVLTEMMIKEKVCICSDHTGTSYYIEDGKNGFIYPSGNSEALCEKIKYVIDHKECLSDIGKAGKDIYKKYLSMDTFSNHLLMLVEEIKR